MAGRVEPQPLLITWGRKKLKSHSICGATGRLYSSRAWCFTVKWTGRGARGRSRHCQGLAGKTALGTSRPRAQCFSGVVARSCLGRCSHARSRAPSYVSTHCLCGRQCNLSHAVTRASRARFRTACSSAETHTAYVAHRGHRDGPWESGTEPHLQREGGRPWGQRGRAGAHVAGSMLDERGVRSGQARDAPSGGNA